MHRYIDTYIQRYFLSVLYMHGDVPSTPREGMNALEIRATTKVNLSDFSCND